MENGLYAPCPNSSFCSECVAKNLSNDWNAALSSVTLSKGERILGNIVTQYETVRQFSRKKYIVASERVTEKTTSNGYLFFTTERLLFVEKRGFFNTTFHCRASINYEEILSVNTGGWVFAYFSVADKFGMEHRFHITSESTPTAKRAIEELINQRKLKLEQEKKRVQVVLDLSFLRPYAAQGIILKDFSCPYCGGKLEVPTTGQFFSCKYCGRNIYATDVFDRIRSLIDVTSASIFPNMGATGATSNPQNCQFFKRGECSMTLQSSMGALRNKNGCQNENRNSCCYICRFSTACRIMCTQLG